MILFTEYPTKMCSDHFLKWPNTGDISIITSQEAGTDSSPSSLLYGHTQVVNRGHGTGSEQ